MVPPLEHRHVEIVHAHPVKQQQTWDTKMTNSPTRTWFIAGSRTDPHSHGMSIENISKHLNRRMQDAQILNRKLDENNPTTHQSSSTKANNIEAAPRIMVRKRLQCSSVFHGSRWFRHGSSSLAVEDSAENVAGHDLFRCNLEGWEIGQVLLEAPLRLEASRNGHCHVEYA